MVSRTSRRLPSSSATTALQSTPAEAREKASGHTARVIKPAVKQPHGEKRPAEKQPLKPGQQASVTTQASFPTGPIATSASNPGPALPRRMGSSGVSAKLPEQGVGKLAGR
jgi:hypothetical protein